MSRLALRRCLGVGLLAGLSLTLSHAQTVPEAPSDDDGQVCSRLTQLDLKGAAGGPAIITGARIVDVPASGFPQLAFEPSGFALTKGLRHPTIRRFCDVTGYVAPQSKFNLKLPLRRDWNEKFFFYACGGFCGSVLSDFCTLGLVRGYASVTGNGAMTARRASTASGRPTRQSSRKILPGAAITW
jgi:hypothetical protein